MGFCYRMWDLFFFLFRENVLMSYGRARWVGQKKFILVLTPLLESHNFHKELSYGSYTFENQNLTSYFKVLLIVAETKIAAIFVLVSRLILSILISQKTPLVANYRNTSTDRISGSAKIPQCGESIVLKNRIQIDWFYFKDRTIYN